MTTEEKIRWLAEQAGWRDTKLVRGRTLWEHSGLGRSFELPDYLSSLDAIARDLLPLLREKGWALTLYCTPEEAEAWITNRREQSLCGAVRFSLLPATAAFEAIFEALYTGDLV